VAVFRSAMLRGEYQRAIDNLTDVRAMRDTAVPCPYKITRPIELTAERKRPP
jgi:hypothetical protein